MSETENRAAEAGALWGGRFESGPSPELQLLSKSTQFDWVLAQYDIRGSKAHAAALASAGYLDEAELGAMREALDELAAREQRRGQRLRRQRQALQQRAGPRARLLDPLRAVILERGQARAGGDDITLIESHLRDAPGLAESQLNLADVDVAIEAQCILVVMAAREPERQCTAKGEQGNNDHGPTGFSCREVRSCH